MLRVGPRVIRGAFRPTLAAIPNRPHFIYKRFISNSSSTDSEDVVDDFDKLSRENLESVELPRGDQEQSEKGAVMVDDEGYTPPRHCFDTQKMFASLKYAGYTTRQAETIVSVVKSMVEDIFESTEERSVPKSAAANEAYLFDAASSEIYNEAHTQRISQDLQFKSGVGRLQRESEILEHESNELTTLLKADMDMDINERKNMARSEENQISLRLQEITNKINVQLASELKSEIERLRWAITRIGIGAVVVVAAAVIYFTKLLMAEEQKRIVRPNEESRGAEFQVPMLSSSLFSEDPEDVAVQELNYEAPKDDAGKDKSSKSSKSSTTG